MRRERTNLQRTLFLVQLSLLVALEAIFCFTPLGSLPALGPIVATLAAIPVVVAAISLGVGAGAFIGFCAGVFSLIVWTFMPPNPLIAFVFSPFYTVGNTSGNMGSLLISVGSRVMIGVTAGLSFRVLHRAFPSVQNRRNDIISYGLAGVIGSLTNTFLVLGGVYVFFGNAYAEALGFGYELLLGMIGLTVLTSGIPEAVVNGVVAYAVCRPLRSIRRTTIRRTKRKFLGVDMGATTTKIVACNGQELTAVSGLIQRDDHASIDSIVTAFLAETGLSADAYSGVYVTGIASSAIGDTLLGLPVHRQEEFAAIVRGGLTLANETRAVVVNIGTGTAFVRADENSFTHLGGSGLGGGMLLGLCRHWYQLDSFDAIVESASRGDLSRIDLRIGDMTDRQIGTLPPHATVANFGKVDPNASPEDVVHGLINVLLEGIGVMATMACGTDRRVVVTGGLTSLPQARTVFDSFFELTGVHFVVPDNAAYATAYGAVLCGLESEH